MAYWETLHGILQEEPVEERDRLFMYILKELGIEKDKPFNPNARQKQILEETENVEMLREAMAKLPGIAGVETKNDPDDVPYL
jgi:hypothetical protein